MSSNCEPVIDTTGVGIREVQQKIVQLLQPTAATFEASYPRANDIRLVIATTVTPLAIDDGYEHYKACLVTTYRDRLQDVQLVSECHQGTGGSPTGAKKHAIDQLADRVSSLSEQTATRYKQLIAKLHPCRFEADAELEQLFVKVGDKEIGPFAGTAIALDCLPTNNLVVRYEVSGVKREGHEVSEGSCATGAVKLPVPPKPEGSPEVPIEGQPRVDGVESNGSGSVAWIAAGGAGVVLVSALLVVLTRSLWKRPKRRAAILFLASNPAKTKRLSLDEEARDIEVKIRAAEHRDLLAFRTRWAVRTDDLLQALNEDRPTVVHFSGHGAGEEGLVLTDENGATKYVPGSALEHLFATLKDNIRVVVLNACFSKEQASSIAKVIDCVIGMSDALGDKAARRFAAAFYGALGSGRSVKNAFDQGIAALKLEALPDDKIPELLVRDGVNADEVVIAKPQD